MSMQLLMTQRSEQVVHRPRRGNRAGASGSSCWIAPVTSLSNDFQPTGQGSPQDYPHRHTDLQEQKRQQQDALVQPDPHPDPRSAAMKRATVESMLRSRRRYGEQRRSGGGADVADEAVTAAVRQYQEMLLLERRRRMEEMEAHRRMREGDDGERKRRSRADILASTRRLCKYDDLRGEHNT
ncbi:hypothetical protein SMMN14_07412 [Sphaerulina musiva]